MKAQLAFLAFTLALTHASSASATPYPVAREIALAETMETTEVPETPNNVAPSASEVPANEYARALGLELEAPISIVENQPLTTDAPFRTIEGSGFQTQTDGPLGAGEL